MTETRPSSLSFPLLFLLLFAQFTIVTSYGHNRLRLLFYRRNTASLQTPNGTLAEAQQIVDCFHATMAIANAAKRDVVRQRHRYVG